MFKCQASAFLVTYPVTNMIDDSNDANGKAVEWERAFIKLAKVCSLVPFRVL